MARPRQVSEEDWEEWKGNRTTEAFFERLKKEYGDLEKELVMASNAVIASREGMMAFAGYALESKAKRQLLDEIIQFTEKDINDYFSE